MATATATPKLLTFAAAARILGISPHMVNRETAAGRLKSVALPGELLKLDAESVYRRAAALGRTPAEMGK
jgi:predicted site-specific integrase-resolvase